MRILLVKDTTIDLDLTQSVAILNKLCKTLTFEEYDHTLKMPSTNIELTDTESRLKTLVLKNKVDHVFLSTSKPYSNNYFFYSSDKTTVLSFFGWNHYTNLPAENGLFYFIAQTQALGIDSSFRHEETTGCVNDFLWDKTAVDLGLKTGRFCEDCLTRIKREAKSSIVNSSILNDVQSILNTVSSASQWEESIFEYERQPGKSSNWASFEDDVAQMYRQLGAHVEQNLNLAGFQIDIMVKEETPSKQTLRSAIECKYTKNKVGNRIVNDFGRIVETLKSANIVERGIIVSQTGFTPDAHLVSKQNQVVLLTYADLKQEVILKHKTQKGSADIPLKKNGEKEIDKPGYIAFDNSSSINKHKEKKSPNLFVIMPFTTDLDDVYYFGIHETAKDLGCSCDRVDQQEFIGPIVEKIYDSIKGSRIILAEVSIPNVNVYYELGYAHALEKPTILITKDISSSPFDLRGYNHIIYTNIRDLRSKLKARLQAILMGS